MQSQTPPDIILHCLRGLPVRQALHELQHQYTQQPDRLQRRPPSQRVIGRNECRPIFCELIEDGLGEKNKKAARWRTAFGTPAEDENKASKTGSGPGSARAGRLIGERKWKTFDLCKLAY